MASLSGEMQSPEDYEPDRRTLFGYLYWRWKWENFYAPLITLGLFIVVYFVVSHSSWVRNRLATSDTFFFNAYRYEKAVEACEKVGKRLPADREELQENLDSVPDYKAKQGYWLKGKKVFFPADQRVTDDDGNLHWTLCVE